MGGPLNLAGSFPEGSGLSADASSLPEGPGLAAYADSTILGCISLNCEPK